MSLAAQYVYSIYRYNDHEKREFVGSTFSRHLAHRLLCDNSSYISEGIYKFAEIEEAKVGITWGSVRRKVTYKLNEEKDNYEVTGGDL